MQKATNLPLSIDGCDAVPEAVRTHPQRNAVPEAVRTHPQRDAVAQAGSAAGAVCDRERVSQAPIAGPGRFGPHRRSMELSAYRASGAEDCLSERSHTPPPKSCPPPPMSSPDLETIDCRLSAAPCDGVWRSLVLASFALVLFALPAVAQAVEAHPNPVLIDAFFAGGEVRVTGTTKAGSHVFVRIAGKTGSEDFNRKGRILGLWANTGKIEISGAPTLFLVADSGPDHKLDRQSLNRYLLDFEAVAAQMEIAPSTPQDDFWRNEYIELKKSQKSYGVFPGTVSVPTTGTGTGTGTGESVAYEAVIPWPDRAPVGEYRVDVIHVEAGKVASEETTGLTVEMAGFPAWIATMAFQRSALYGLLSVVIALTVGFATGLIFKKGGGH
ncbi:MAG: TIGR02186 family protein [Pseudomonadota bacterium]